MNFLYDGAYSMPGQGTVRETYENQFWFGERHQQMWTGMLLSGASRDTGNTSYTTVLRTGLLMGMVTATKKIKEWNPTGTDGSENILGVLDIGISPQRLGADADKWLAYLMVGGTVKADRILVPGQTSLGLSGQTYEHIIRAQMHRRFIFSDKWEGNPFGGWKNIVAETGTTRTITEAENNTLFTNRGASGNVVFTLPTTPKKGLRYGFHAVAAGTMTVGGAANVETLVAYNNATADSVAFSTASSIIGGRYVVEGDGTSWLVTPNMWASAADASQITTVTDA